MFRPEWENAFDLVLVDAPCSGLGVIRKKPDIRYKDPAPLADLPAVQLDILRNAARYVKPGGTLMYSTCTLLYRENTTVFRNDPAASHTSFSLAFPYWNRRLSGSYISHSNALTFSYISH